MLHRVPLTGQPLAPRLPPSWIAMGMARCGADVALLDVPAQAEKLEQVAEHVRRWGGSVACMGRVHRWRACWRNCDARRRAACCTAQPAASHTARILRQVREAGVRALPLHADVKDRPAVERAVEEAARQLGGPHILMANAGGSGGRVLPCAGSPGTLQGARSSCCASPAAPPRRLSPSHPASRRHSGQAAARRQDRARHVARDPGGQCDRRVSELPAGGARGPPSSLGCCCCAAACGCAARAALPATRRCRRLLLCSRPALSAGTTAAARCTHT